MDLILGSLTNEDGSVGNLYRSKYNTRKSSASRRWRHWTTGADLGGLHWVRTPPDYLRLSNTTGILQNMQICMICILSSSNYVTA